MQLRVLRLGLLQAGDVGVGHFPHRKRHSLAMLAPVSQELRLATNRFGTDFLKLSRMAQRRKQRIGVESRIRAEVPFDSFAQKSYCILLSTADRFVLRCNVTQFGIIDGSCKIMKVFGNWLALSRWSPF